MKVLFCASSLMRSKNAKWLYMYRVMALLTLQYAGSVIFGYCAIDANQHAANCKSGWFFQMQEVRACDFEQSCPK